MVATSKHVRQSADNAKAGQEFHHLVAIRARQCHTAEPIGSNMRHPGGAPALLRRITIRDHIMRAITVLPGVANSARLDDIPPPPPSDGAILVRTLALGVCGTDREIVAGRYGATPPGEQRLVLGHESLGRVVEAPPGSGFAPGDHLVGIVRRPDPVPCPACAAGEWDMCRNGRYVERGIKERHGYGAEQFRVEPDFAIRIDPALGILGVLVEPASVVAKAWDHTDRVGARSRAWQPRSVLVTGAGPIGLLAAMMGQQRGLEVHVLDRSETGPKPALARALGATYHWQGLAELDGLAPDILIECTGAPAVIRDVHGRTAPDGIVCLAGVSAPGHAFEFDIGSYNRSMVLNNETVFGTVNANRRHYETAERALARADKTWLAGLITRRVPVTQWHEAIENRADDIKVIVDFTA
jgi:threonine dehydrogenase-like Zn-dependent dehydrogenase